MYNLQFGVNIQLHIFSYTLKACAHYNNGVGSCSLSNIDHKPALIICFKTTKKNPAHTVYLYIAGLSYI